MKVLVFAVFAVWMSVPSGTLAQDPIGEDRLGVLRAQFEELKADLNSSEEKFSERYAEQLAKLEESAATSGNLDLVIAVREEAITFRTRTGNVVPSALPDLAQVQKIYREQVGVIRSEQRDRLLTLMKGHHGRLMELRAALTKSREIDSALKVQEEIDRLEDAAKRIQDGRGVAGVFPKAGKPAGAAKPPEQLPDPDGTAADQTKPVKVFILMGQSNMLGFGKVGPEGQKGTLAYLTKTEKKYPHLVDDEGNWTERNDVRNVHVMTGKVMKNGWLTVSGNHIGPDLQFGYIMGEVFDETVLVLKACIGNRSLGWDLLPPGSEQFEYGGKIYAGYKETPSSWAKGTKPKPIAWYAGKQYDTVVADAKNVLENIAKYYPGYKGQGYEVAGFVFWQGHKDQNPAHASRYEQNLVRFIKSLRKDFDAPEAKFVIATIAFGGNKLSGPGLTIAEAQLAVSGETGKYPEFKGNVKTIDARPFWRAASVSPSGDGAHYNHNAGTYMEVGNALGRAMAEMLP